MLTKINRQVLTKRPDRPVNSPVPQRRVTICHTQSCVSEDNEQVGLDLLKQLKRSVSYNEEILYVDESKPIEDGNVSKGTELVTKLQQRREARVGKLYLDKKPISSATLPKTREIKPIGRTAIVTAPLVVPKTEIITPKGSYNSKKISRQAVISKPT